MRAGYLCLPWTLKSWKPATITISKVANNKSHVGTLPENAECEAQQGHDLQVWWLSIHLDLVVDDGIDFLRDSSTPVGMGLVNDGGGGFLDLGLGD